MNQETIQNKKTLISDIWNINVDELTVSKSWLLRKRLISLFKDLGESLERLVLKFSNLLKEPTSYFAWLLAFIFKLIEPIYVVRFGALSGSAAQLPVRIELFKGERREGLQGGRFRTIHLFYYQDEIGSSCLDALINRRLIISPLAREIYQKHLQLPGWCHTTLMPSDEDESGLLKKYSTPFLKFSYQEKLQGENALKALGLPDASEFTLIDFGTYQSDKIPNELPLYKDLCVIQDNQSKYPDKKARQSLTLLENLKNENYYVIHDYYFRDLENKKSQLLYIEPDKRSDFLKTYLQAKCRFLICYDVEIAYIARSFRRPVIYINLLSIDSKTLLKCAADSLFIPKRYWLITEERYLTLSETVGLTDMQFKTESDYLSLGIKPVDSTPDEMFALATEMDARLQGTWSPEDQDDALQAQFWELCSGQLIHQRLALRIGSQFLRDNLGWLS